MIFPLDPEGTARKLEIMECKRKLAVVEELLRNATDATTKRKLESEKERLLREVARL